MKSSYIKYLVVFLFSLMIVSTAYCTIGFQGERDIYPDKKGEGKEIVYMAINVGRIIGNIVFTMDEDFVLNQNFSQVIGLRSNPTPFRDSRNIAIAFGIIALLFLISSVYFKSKIIEYIKSRGKAHK